MESIQRFFRHSYLSYKALFGMMDIKSYFLFMVFNPVTQLLFFGVLVNYVYDGKGLTGYIAANALLLCVLSSVFGMMTVVMSDRGSGTLPIVIASPANKGILFFSRTLPHVISGFITSILGLVAGLLIFQQTIELEAILPLLLIWGISIFSACCLGLILGACSLWTPSMHLLSNILASTLLLLSGANYSIEVMPTWLRSLAEIFPLTRGVQLTKSIINDGNYSQVSRLLVEEAVLGIIFLIISIFMIRYAEYKARMKGTMELS